MYIIKKTTTRKDNKIQVELIMRNIPYTFIGHADIEGLSEENIIAFSIAEQIAFFNATKGYENYLITKGVDHVEYDKRNEQNGTRNS